MSIGKRILAGALPFIAAIIVVLDGSSALAITTTNGGGSIDAHWVNIATIAYGDKLFTQSNIAAGGNIWTYEADTDGCKDTIEPSYNRTITVSNKINLPPENGSAILKIGSMQAGTATSNAKCSYASATIYLSQAANAAISFRATDANHYQMLGSPITFSLDTARGLITRDGDDTCKDTIQVQSGATTGTLISRVRPQRDGTSIRKDYNYYPFASYLYVDHTADSCMVSTTAPISLTNSAVDTTTSGGAGGGGGATGDATAPDPCVTATGAYAWLFCPAFRSAKDALVGKEGNGGIYGVAIKPMLEMDPLTQASPIKPVWAAFVQIADVLFVLAFLVLIFGQTLSLDAYTIKKALPRLVIAAIAVQLSYFLCGIVIDIGNILGAGIGSFVASALGDSNTSTNDMAKRLVSGGAAAILTVLGVGTTVAVLGFGLIAMFVGLLISAFTFFVTLAVRKLVLNILILLAPLALVAWILPNTERYFKLWRDNFVKLVMVYPIIALILSGGYILQRAATGNSQTATSQIDQILAGLAPIIAFFMMPKAFAMSGKTMSMANNAIRSKGNAFGGWAKKNTQKGVDNSALLKERKETRLRKNLATMNDPNAGGIRRRIAQRKAGLGFAQTAGAMATGYSKLESIEKANESGATRQLSDIQPTELKKILEKKAGEEVVLTAADGTKRLMKVSEDHKTAAIRMMANKQQWDDLRAAKGSVSPVDMSKGLAGTDAITKARDLIMKPEAAFADVTADSLGNMHHSTVTQYMNHVRDLKKLHDDDPSEPVAAANYQKAVTQLHTAATGVLGNNNLRSKLSAETTARLSEAANGVNVTGTPKQDPIMQDSPAIDIVNSHIDPASKLLRPSQDKASKFVGGKDAYESLLDQHVSHLASTGQVVTRQDLESRYATDQSFKLQVDSAAMNNKQVHEMPEIKI